jgi:hypothetical protein
MLTFGGWLDWEVLRVARSRGWAGALGFTVDAVWWLSLVAVAAAAVLLVVVATHVASGGALRLGFYFQLPASRYRISAHQLSGSAVRVGLSSGQLAFARPRASFVLLSSGVLALAAGAWLFILHQLRRLLAALRAGETFARENERRLRRIGLAVIAFELSRSLVVWGGGLYLEHALVARGVILRSHFAIDVPLILAGVVLLALAAAFRVGAELAEEQALTV